MTPLQRELRKAARKFAEELKEAGFTVYMLKKSDSTGMHFVKGGKIGYADIGAFGWNFSTCHKPNRLCGTGYSIARDTTPSVALAKAACDIYQPSWAEKGHNPVKWASWEEYEKHPINHVLKYIEV